MEDHTPLRDDNNPFEKRRFYKCAIAGDPLFFFNAGNTWFVMSNTFSISVSVDQNMEKRKKMGQVLHAIPCKQQALIMKDFIFRQFS